MYSFTNGYFDAWSPSFDVLQFEESRKIPLPTNKTYKTFSDGTGYKITGDNLVKTDINEEGKKQINLEREVLEVISINDPAVFNIDKF